MPPPQAEPRLKSHTRKPYTRPSAALLPSSLDPSSRSRLSSNSSALTTLSSRPAERKAEKKLLSGFGSGLTRFLQAPLGWIGLGGSGSSSSSSRHDIESSTAQPPSPSSSAPPKRLAPPASQLRYLPSASQQGQEGYNDPPLSSFAPPRLGRASPAPSLMRRSETMSFPVSSRSNGGAGAGGGGWEDSYENRLDSPGVPDRRMASPALSAAARRPSPAFPSHLRPLPRSQSVQSQLMAAPPSSAGGRTRDRSSRMSVSSDEDSQPVRKKSKTPAAGGFGGGSVSFASGLSKLANNGAVDRKSSRPAGGAGQMVWTPESGFLSRDSLARQRSSLASRPPIEPNAAERILQSLEALRTPLSSVPPFTVGLPRSMTTGRIHVPVSEGEGRRAPLRKTDGTSVAISPYGRERARREKEEKRGGGMKNILAKSGNQRREGGEEEEEEEGEREEMRGESEKERKERKTREREDRRQRRKDERERERQAERASLDRMDDDDDDETSRPSSSATLSSTRQASRSPLPPPPPPQPKPTSGLAQPPITSSSSSSASKPVLNALPASELAAFNDLPSDDSSFQAVAAASSKSSLRARSTATKRQHVAAAGSRASTPVQGPSSGRFSAREEDLQDGSSTTMVDGEAKLKFAPVGEVKKQVGPVDFFAKPSSSATNGAGGGVAAPKPFTFGEGPLLPSTPKTSSPLSSAGSTTPAVPPLAAGAGKPPTFFASSLNTSTDSPAVVLPSSIGLGLPSSSAGSTTPAAPPPPSKSPLSAGPPPAIPNFFAKTPAAAPAAAPSTTPSTNPFATVGVERKDAPEPVKAVPASNPFAGVGTTGGSAAESVKAPTPSTGFSFGAPAPKPAATSASPFAFGSTPAPAAPVAAPSSNPFAFGAAATTKKDDAPAPPSAAPSFSFGALKPTPDALPPPPSAPASNPFAGVGGATDPVKPSVVAPPSSTSSLFGSSTPAPDAPKPAFSFGAPAAKPSLGSLPAASAKEDGGMMEQSPERPAQPIAPAAAPVPSFSFGSATPAAATIVPASTSSPFSFGSSATTPAAAPPVSKPAFSFGAPSPAAAPTANPFGSTSTTPAAPATSNPFGSSTPAAPPAPSFSFGGSAPSTTPAFGSVAPAPAFGSGVSTPAFGSSSTSPAFGQSTSPSAAVFGSSAPSTSSPFGAPAAAPAPASSGFTFGAPSGTSSPSIAPSTGFAFGSTSTPPGSAGGFGSAPAPAFGQSAPTAPAPSFSFGSSTVNPPAFGAGAGASSPFGTSSSSPAFGQSTTTAPAAAAPSFAFGGTGTPPPTFGSPGPQSPSTTGPALFSMGASDSAASPARMGPNGRPIRPLGSRRAGSKKP